MSLLLLSLPWAGCQYLQAVDVALRDFQEASLISNAESMADRLMAKPGLFSDPYINTEPFNLALYTAPFNSQPIMDGYKDDWRNYSAEVKVFKKEPLSASVMSAKYKEQVYFFIEVDDAELNYFNPVQTQSLLADHLLLTLNSDLEQERKVYLYTSAPGNIVVRYRDANNRLRLFSQIKGVWREKKAGYQIELEVDKSLLSEGFNIDIVDVRGLIENRLSLKDAETTGTQYKRLELIAPSESLEAALQRLNLNATSAYILNTDQFIVANREGDEKVKKQEATPWFIEWLYRKSLKVDAMPPRMHFFKTFFWDIPEGIRNKDDGVGVFWYRIQRQRLGSEIAVGAVVPLFSENTLKGFLLLEKTTDSLVALTDSAFNRLFLYTLSVFLLVAIGLISYASWLSWRISRLNRTSDQVVTDQGILSLSDKEWPELKSADELGDLSRSYRQLLLKLRESQEYLRGLSSKLSHELRTPIAIVRSSLDNIAEVSDPILQQQYNQRAQQGIERLNHILNAMSAANRIEESVLGAEFTLTPVNDFLSSLVEVYNDVYSEYQIQFIDEAEPVSTLLSQELFVQMLDKLVDNATDFSPKEEPINIRLQVDAGAIVVQVENKGSLLPESMEGRLFESMVSLRSDKVSSEGVHLGLGLYIVRIIAELHQGQAFAQNDDGKGVIFSVSLPIQ